MAFAVIQEFPIEGSDRTTANYDRVQEALGTSDNPPAGGLVHTAGFDEDAGVFRIFDVWESEEAWNAFLQDRLMPVVEPLMEQGGRPPETRTYRLDDFMAAPGAGA
jgi:quinol monooxygenase YgiN